MSAAAGFTGERLHADDDLFGVDLARHRAAYAFAAERTLGGRWLDLGSGSGYGTASLAGRATVVGVDRVAPDAGNRPPGIHYLRADLGGLPLAAHSFDGIVSFQVIEHLEDPTDYLRGMAALLAEDGLAILTTPNVRTSDGVNPVHVHEYAARELETTLSRHFREVTVQGVGASEPVRAYMAARSRRIRRIVALDPLRLRDRLPRAVVTRLFAFFALVVRRRTREGEGAPRVDVSDFPVGPASDDCLDLLALCRGPR